MKELSVGLVFVAIYAKKRCSKLIIQETGNVPSPELYFNFKTMIYYFAYGSNMNTAQMKERCPDSKLTGKAVLKNYKLDFTIFSPKRNCGCADIVKSPEQEVYGLLYFLTPRDLKKLDTFEGHPNKYRRFTTKVINRFEEEVEAETYEVVGKQKEFQRPSKDYLDKLIKAANRFNFPNYYQNYLKNTTTLN